MITIETEHRRRRPYFGLWKKLRNPGTLKGAIWIGLVIYRILRWADETFRPSG